MRRSILVVFLLAAAACARPPLELPSGPSAPVSDIAPIVTEALGHCEGLASLTAELGLSGRVGREKLRGRLLAGFQRPDGIRLEGLAPFGAPVFILAGRDGMATLLLPRDARVLRGAPPAEVVEALAGVAVAPGDLLDWLGGCAGAARWASGRQYGEDWVALESGDHTAWFRRRQASWRLAAVRRGDLIAEIVTEGVPQPTRLRLRRPERGTVPAVDISLSVAGAERNVELSAAAFEVDVPEDVVDITIDDLRRSGPLRDVAVEGAPTARVSSPRPSAARP
jgi:hypothetical protein